jgi:hypothetical protein
LVQIQPLHPISEGPQAPAAQGVAASEAGVVPPPIASDEYHNYSSAPEFFRVSGAACYGPYVSLRSKPVAIAPALTKAGNPTWRITGTINGRQRINYRESHDEAEALRDQWELERLSGAAAMRSKPTRLTKAQIEEAEACHFMIKDSGYTLTDAVTALLRNPPPKLSDITFREAYQKFLEERKGTFSDAQYANYLSPCRRLSEHLGHNAKLVDVTPEKVTNWLKQTKVKKKSWNNYRGDLIVVFNWFAARPRQWINENPVTPVLRYRKRDTLPGPIRALRVDEVREMMAWLEREKPHWVTCFAIAIFIGIRPDREDGEMMRLSEAIAQHGIGEYFRGHSLYVSAQIAKDGRPRTIPLPSNLEEWLRFTR